MVNKTAATAMVLSSFIFSTECNVYVESMSCIVLQGVVLTCKRLATILSLTTYKASLTVFVYRPIEIMAMLGQQYCLAVLMWFCGVQQGLREVGHLLSTSQIIRTLKLETHKIWNFHPWYLQVHLKSNHQITQQRILYKELRTLPVTLTLWIPSLKPIESQQVKLVQK